MAHSLSAKKRIRQTAKRRARNRFRKEMIKDEVKTFTTAIAGGEIEKATAALKTVVSRLDKVAAKGTIHKKTASRKRSRLAKKLNVARVAGVVVKQVAGKGRAKTAKPA